MNKSNAKSTIPTSRDEQEIAGFSAQAETWWDPRGPFAPLHQINPLRISVLAEMASLHFKRPLDSPHPFRGLNLTDAGCGGGLVTEPCARLGFSVTGIDPSSENINVAKLHANASGLDIEYITGSPEEVKSKSSSENVILALEVIEHVADVSIFIEDLADRLAPNGLLIISTINRTLKSLALAKMAAEYVFCWIPPGTHEWKKFVKPSELANHVRCAGLRVIDIQGMQYDLSTDAWCAGDDVSINYMLAATRS